MVCTSNGETEVGAYSIDCLFVLTTAEDGKKIVKLTEWLGTRTRR